MSKSLYFVIIELVLEYLHILRYDIRYKMLKDTYDAT